MVAPLHQLLFLHNILILKILHELIFPQDVHYDVGRNDVRASSSVVAPSGDFNVGPSSSVAPEFFFILELHHQLFL